ncbi:MAG: nucleotidyltransferase domain-containing protein [Lachnospiraceae bacterium]|nr:nucleotidyltransferase domain-containing protein [Lachnospiraceae bacterium]
MSGAEALDRISDKESVDNIRELTRVFVDKLRPEKVILFGSFASGAYSEESDFDFYIVIEDGRNVTETAKEAYRASIEVKTRPVDIVVGTNSRFELKRKADYSLMVEGEVERNGILLYDRDEIVA